MWQCSDLIHKEADYKGDRRRKFIRKKCKKKALVYIAKYVYKPIPLHQQEANLNVNSSGHKNKYVLLSVTTSSPCDE